MALFVVAPGYLQSMADDETGQWMILGALVLGAVAVLILERRRRKRREESAFMENWRKTHKDGSPFPWAG